MEIDGTWRVRYAMKAEEPFINEAGDPDEVGTLTLAAGKVSGNDRFGFEYVGFYSLDGNVLTASVISSPFEDDAISIIDGTHRRFHMEFVGEYNSPNYVSLRGHEVGKPGDVADCFEIGFNTAIRPGEVRRLTWSQIDFDSAEIQLREGDTKTREPRVIPMNRRVLEILRRRSSAPASRWIFRNQAGDGPRDEISKIIRPIAKRLGLEYGRELENGFTPHSRRHTATTECFVAAWILGTVKSITGHTDSAMALRYAVRITRESPARG